MKAMILAAGRGERLRPYTDAKPKALFPLSDRPLLDILIRRLRRSGCRAVIINTHHLSDQIERFLRDTDYGIPIVTRYEPQPLDTGGAIGNVADFWDRNPFMVVNCDIVTDIDLASVYRTHLDHPYPVTLALCHDPEFNTVQVDKNGFVLGFLGETPASSNPAGRLTFTGIQVLDPEILRFIPDDRASGIKDVYKQLLAEERGIKAYVDGSANGTYWKDIGTPDRYRQAACDAMASEAFGLPLRDSTTGTIGFQRLKGDGSDRKWFRLTSGDRSLVMVDHGIHPDIPVSEADSFIAIGKHLKRKGIPVPDMVLADPFSGLVFLEDLGDANLQSEVMQTSDSDRIHGLYLSVVRQLLQMSRRGGAGFDPAWAYQSPQYDKALILERECRYFVDAFLNGWLQQSSDASAYRDEFEELADRALASPAIGFMHRDFQSRNIMVKNGSIHFIDFQGGRIGPLTYDVASLLIDPYVNLPYSLQHRLLADCIDLLPDAGFAGIDPGDFRQAYLHCAMTRNLQILGAFGFLSLKKGKTYFEQYIPPAMESLKRIGTQLEAGAFPKLKALVGSL